MIPTNYLKAALLFAGVNDIRACLNGVYFTSEAIYATDGHRAIKIRCTTELSAPVTVSRGYISIEVALASKTKKIPITAHPAGVQVGLNVYPVLDCSYPDLDLILMSLSNDDSAQPTSLCCDWDYLAGCQKAIRLIAKTVPRTEWEGEPYSEYVGYDLASSRILVDPRLDGIVQMVVFRRTGI